MPNEGASVPKERATLRDDGASLLERFPQKRLWVCVGAGGVGKTTVSAALALGLAREGGRTLVVSIDPARRLASALGLERLPGEPHRIEPQALRSAGAQLEGELWAMVLDPKQTFDTLIERLTSDERAREEVLSNRIYRELSTATAGSQEFTAVAKLFELDSEGGFDAIVLDTPPSRNALDFLDAPDRMRGFLEGRALRALLRPGGIAGSLLGRGSGLMFAVLGRATGVDLLKDLSTFFRSLGGVLDGFSQRARAVEGLLRDPRTAFVVVTSPEPEPLGEARFLHAHLRSSGFPFAGVVVNRVHETGLDGDPPARLLDERPQELPDGRRRELPEEGQRRELLEGRLLELLGDELEERLVGKLAENLADFELLARRDRQSIELLGEELGSTPVLVPQLDGEVQDLAGLARVAEHLVGSGEVVRSHVVGSDAGLAS